MADTLRRRMRETIPAERWPGRGEPLVVAVSGGPDSTALAWLLHEMNQTENCGWALHLAHLNHQLRGSEAQRDADFVTRLAQQQGWNFTVESRPIRQLAGQSKLTIEETARQERYQFFEQVAQHYGGKAIATAHHADDHIETILHRLLRGTGLRGLAGIPPCRPLHNGSPVWIIRPMLNVLRSEIMRYLHDHRFEYCHDESNDQLQFTRNRVRHELLPYLEKNFNPAVRGALLRLGEQTRWMYDHLQELVQAKYPLISWRDSEEPQRRAVELAVDLLQKESPLVQSELIRMAVVELGAAEKSITFQHYLAVMDLIEDKTTGKHLQLPGGLLVTRQREQIVLALLPARATS
ncbi:MAG: tRNA(Ile)-lysidine synthase [Phycisphaerae bacterium]|nr:tRNA(Ile)-lysidine synthase [Phycisphaerae bacterium]